MLKTVTPTLVLGSLLLGLLVAACGVTLARRENVIRVSADRSALLSLGTDLQKELKRLDEVYEKDLNDLIDSIDANNTVRTQQLIRTVLGVRACCILRQHSPDETILVRADSNDVSLPEISLKLPLWNNALTLSDPRLFFEDNPSNTGWNAIPARPPLRFFGRTVSPGLGLILILDGDKVESATRDHLVAWSKAHLGTSIARHEINAIVSPQGPVAETAALPQDRGASLAIPLTSLWGAWQILSWDRPVTTISYHLPTLVSSAALAIMVALGGILLARAQHRAQQLAEQRVSFVNRVSHELGTPLTNMLLNLDLAREFMDASPEDALKRLSLVEEETRRLARLTANVLTFSRSERGTLQIHTSSCVPDEILRNVVDHFSPALQRRGIEIEMDLQVREAFPTDADALAQITGNLISNVEKYAATGAWMRISSSIIEGRLVVRMADRGPGIPPGEREHIFRPFHRVNNRVNEGSTGAGLGLSIARDLAQRLGGELRLLEAPQGAVFELRLPATSLASSSKGAQKAPATHGAEVPA